MNGNSEPSHSFLFAQRTQIIAEALGDADPLVRVPKLWWTIRSVPGATSMDDATAIAWILHRVVIRFFSGRYTVSTTALRARDREREPTRQARRALLMVSSYFREPS